MLKSISLQNWRSHEDSTIVFSKGTNLILGRMGGGKSSVIDAICFALFGTCPAIQSRRIKVGNLVRSRPDKPTEAKITLIFNIGSDTYEIRRKIKKNGTAEGEVLKNGERVEGPQSIRSTEYIRGLLDVDYDIFVRAIYSEQNRIDHFLMLPKGERKRQIDELIGIDRFEKVRKNAGTVISRLKTLHADRETIIKSFNLSQAQTELDELKKKLETTQIKITQLTTQVSETESKRKQLEEKHASVSKDKELFRSLTEKKAGLHHTAESLKSELEKANASQDEADKLKINLEETGTKKSEIQSDLKATDLTYTSLSVKVGELDTTESTLQDQIKKRTDLQQKMDQLLSGKAADILKSQLFEFETTVAFLTKEIAEKKATATQLDKAISELTKDIARCPICDSDLSGEKKDKILDEKRKQKDTELNESSKASVDLEKTSKEMKELKIRIDEVASLLSRLTELTGLDSKLKLTSEDKGKIKAEVQVIKEKKDQLAKQFEEVSNQYLELTKSHEKMNEILNKKKKFDEISTQAKEIEAQLLNVTFNETEFEELNKNLREISSLETERKGKLENSKQSTEYLTKMISDKNERLKEVTSYQSEISEYIKSIEQLQIFSNAIVETQHALREELIEAVNEALGEIWRVVYPYSDYPILTLQPSESDYDLVFVIDDEHLSVDGIASGGERALACLALRVAFAMVLTPNLSWLILDEPTHNLDAEAVKTLAITLRDHIPKLVEQIFVITHEENLRDAASGNMFMIQRDPKKPEVSIVEVLKERAGITPTLNE